MRGQAFAHAVKVRLQFQRDHSGDITWEEVERYHATQGLMRKGRAAESKRLVQLGMSERRAKREAARMSEQNAIQRAHELASARWGTSFAELGDQV